mmetsp:Transcript_33496/g.37371  ORF Transcript_33496/g.37371 Transcript_33496/m.37371 type:complete len:210 (-) Transcript_33496:3095-3724(-)
MANHFIVSWVMLSIDGLMKRTGTRSVLHCVAYGFQFVSKNDMRSSISNRTTLFSVIGTLSSLNRRINLHLVFFSLPFPNFLFLSNLGFKLSEFKILLFRHGPPSSYSTSSACTSPLSNSRPSNSSCSEFKIIFIRKHGMSDLPRIWLIFRSYVTLFRRFVLILGQASLYLINFMRMDDELEGSYLATIRVSFYNALPNYFAIELWNRQS